MSNNLKDFQNQFAYRPQLKRFKSLQAIGVELQLINEIGLVEVAAIGEVTERELLRLINPDGTNNYEWPVGRPAEGEDVINSYKELTEDVVSICCTLYCMQWPTKLYSVDQLIWLFVVNSEAMMSAVELMREVTAKATPLLEMAPVVNLELKMSSPESESNLQENTD